MGRGTHVRIAKPIELVHLQNLRTFQVRHIQPVLVLDTCLLDMATVHENQPLTGHCCVLNHLNPEKPTPPKTWVIKCPH